MKNNIKNQRAKIKNKRSLILCFLVFSLLLSGLSCGKRKELSQKSRGEKEGVGKKMNFETSTIRPFVYDSQGKRDPFVPLAGLEEGPKLAWLSLTGIMWDPEYPMAIINDNIVGKGDKIEGAEVVEIKEDRVILRYGEEEYILRLK